MVTDGCQSEIKALRSHVRRFCRECLAPRDVAKFRSQECFIAWVVIYHQMLVILQVCLYRFKYNGTKPPFEYFYRFSITSDNVSCHCTFDFNQPRFFDIWESTNFRLTLAIAIPYLDKICEVKTVMLKLQVMTFVRRVPSHHLDKMTSRLL